MKSPNQYRRRAMSSSKKLMFFRLVLIATGVSYLIFGWVYKTSIPADFPMPMSHRLGVFLFFFAILASTYLSNWAREHVELLMYLGTLGALSHLIYFSYVNNYSLNYALSILIVIILVNFLLPGDLRLKWLNLAITVGVGTTVLLRSNPTFNRFVYIVSVSSISFISYVLSSSRQSARAEYEQLFRDSPMGLVRCSPEGEVKDFNKEMLRLSGNPPKDSFVGLNMFETMGIEKENLESVDNREKHMDFPWGEEVWVDYSVELIPQGEETPSEVLIACDDITDRKQAEDRVEYITYHDDLTELYNRSFFQHKSEEFAASEFYPLSVIFIDVDKLKLINNAFGHHTGDELLVAASEVVSESCRDDDSVFRWGGDEIVVLLPLTKEKESEKISSRIQKNCDKMEFQPMDLRLSLGRASADVYNKGAGLNHLLKEAEERMYETKVEKQDEVSRDILSTIMEKIEEKASCIIDHSNRVEELALQIGSEMNLQEDRLEKVGSPAKYHDIGKISLEAELIHKNYRELTETETEEFRGHSNIGYQIVKELHQISDLAQPILQHHEWWDGKGYPQGKSGEEISFASRIIALADYYDFLVNPHCNYREKVDKEKALERIRERSGSQFQPRITEAFPETV